MGKEIICHNKNCIHWMLYHCVLERTRLIIDENGKCKLFISNPRYNERIKATLTDQNKGENK